MRIFDFGKVSTGLQIVAHCVDNLKKLEYYNFYSLYMLGGFYEIEI